MITLLRVLAEAGKIQGYDVKTSELHGLSQRGGSVEVHLRFGKKVFSPLISQGRADLILALEMQESLRALSFANPGTAILVNKFKIPIPLQKGLTEEQVFDGLKKVSQNVMGAPAAKICEDELGKPVAAGIFLVSLAVFKDLIPLKEESLFEGIKRKIKPKYLELNKKALDLAKKYAK